MDPLPDSDSLWVIKTFYIPSTKLVKNAPVVPIPMRTLATANTGYTGANIDM